MFVPSRLSVCMHPFVTKLGSVVHHHELECHAKKLGFCLQGEKQMTMAGTLFGRTIQSLLTVTSQVQTCVRTHYVDWKMLRDVKRRQCVKQFNVSRQRLNAIRKNTILPRELQEIADVEVAALPRDSNYIRLRSRCILTSRPRGVLQKWRLSRIVWRHHADYNLMSGITRSCW